MKYNIPRVLIAAPSSGSGKTTAVIGILEALLAKKMNISSFKCGPDYIDPMFHSEVLGTNCRNLDTFLMGEDNVKYSLYNNSKSSEIAIIEGVMGYYDGLLGKSDLHSTYHVAKTIKAPVVLVINGKGASYTIAALIKGITEFRKDSNIVGVIFNNITKMTYSYLSDICENELSIKPLGFIEKMKDCTIESRHLGLVTAKEIGELSNITHILGERISKTVDIDSLIRVAQSAPEIEVPKLEIAKKYNGLTIGVAYDKAFCFYYKDNLDLIESLGCKLEYFSPINDEKLPDNIDGLIIGGGYPELYLDKLEQNSSMRNSIRSALENGLACFAECGGFMYLGNKIQGTDEQYKNSVGFFDSDSHKTPKLVRFGYTNMTASEKNLLAEQGKAINAHEFHYWDSDNNGNLFVAKKADLKRNWECMIQKNNTIAGYPHLHFYGNLEFLYNFLNKCKENKNG